jgi:hypothetical protein
MAGLAGSTCALATSMTLTPDGDGSWPAEPVGVR